MLVFVGGEGHGGEFTGFVELGDCGFVEGEGTERGVVSGALGEGAVGEVKVVRGAEEEDAFSWGGLVSLCLVALVVW